MPDEIFCPIWATSIFVSEHFVLRTKNFTTKWTGGRRGYMHVGNVWAKLAKRFVANLADPAVVGWSSMPSSLTRARCIWTTASSVVDPTNQTTNPCQVTLTYCQAANNNTTWNDRELCAVVVFFVSGQFSHSKKERGFSQMRKTKSNLFSILSHEEHN